MIFSATTRRARAMKYALGFLCLLLLIPHSALAADEARRLVALADYIGGDYKNAVQGGKVVNPDEYQEMKEFSARTLELFNKLKADEKKDKAGIEPDLKALASRIEQRDNERVVGELAQRVKEKLIAAYEIMPYPRRMPSFPAGRILFSPWPLASACS